MQIVTLGILVLELVIPSCLAEVEGPCEGPVCFVVEELDPRNRYIFKIDCNDVTDSCSSKVIGYRCASDVSIGDLTDGIGPSYTTIAEYNDPEETSKEQPSSAFPDDFKEQYVFSFLGVSGCGESDTLLQLFIATVADNVRADGVISFPLHNISDVFFSLSPGYGEFFNLSIMVLPRIAHIAGPRRGKENSTVVVAASEDVSVYGHLKCSGDGRVRSTAFQVRRITDLGMDYRVLSHQVVGHSQVAVVANEDETFVQIFQKLNSTEYLNLTLQKYETYVIESMLDLTGMYIKSSAPVFVLTGNSGENIVDSSGSRDPFYECLIPYSHWGTHYYCFFPFNTTTLILVKIMPWEKNVSVISWENGVKNSSSGLDLNITFGISEDLVRIESPKPILVALFLIPSKVNKEDKDSHAMSMLLVPSASQFTRNYVVFPVFDLNYNHEPVENYVTILMPLGVDINDIYINNSTSIWQIVGNFTDGSTIFRTKLTPGSNVLENRGRRNITALVSANQNKRSYVLALA